MLTDIELPNPELDYTETETGLLFAISCFDEVRYGTIGAHTGWFRIYTSPEGTRWELCSKEGGRPYTLLLEVLEKCYAYHDASFLGGSYRLKECQKEIDSLYEKRRYFSSYGTGSGQYDQMTAKIVSLIAESAELRKQTQRHLDCRNKLEKLKSSHSKVRAILASAACQAEAANAWVIAQIAKGYRLDPSKSV